MMMSMSSGENQNPDDHRPSDSRRCTATRQETGERCGAWAVNGTVVCYHHGGGTKATLKKASQAVALRRLVPGYDWAGHRNIHPGQALLDLVGAKQAELDYWRSVLRDMPADALTWSLVKEKTGGQDWGETHEQRVNVALELMHKAEKDLALYCSLALKAGVEAAQVKIQQQQAEQALAVVNRALEMAGVGAVDRQRVVLQAIQDLQ